MKKQATRPIPTGRARALYLISAIALLPGILLEDETILQMALLGLMIYFVSRWLARWNFRGLELVQRIPEHAYANLEFDVEFELQNRKWLAGSFTVEVQSGLLSRYPRMYTIKWIRARRYDRLRTLGRVMNRGIYETSTYKLRSRFPFGLFSMEEERVDPVRLVVFPRPSVPDYLEAFFQSDLHPSERMQAKRASRIGEFRGLREFSPGDPLRNVHWPSTARSGRVMVREFDPPVPDRYAIVYHCYKPERQMLRVVSFEKSMRILAGIFSQCLDAGVPFEFTASFDQWRPIDVSDPRMLIDPMTSLAGARQVVENSPDEMLRHVKSLRGFTQVFVVSNTPVRYWQSYFDDIDMDVVCIDTSVARRSLRGWKVMTI